MSLRTPIGRARGLGSAKSGTRHFWLQRVTALALVPLTLWFAASLVAMAGADHATVSAWMGGPLASALLVLTIVAGFWHASLGVQVVIEDYVHSEALKIASLVVVDFVLLVLGVASVIAVVRVAVGG